jgi:hypothetical protein
LGSTVALSSRIWVCWLPAGAVAIQRAAAFSSDRQAGSSTARTKGKKSHFHERSD